MEKAKFIWMNGRLAESGDAKIHVLTHSLHYGSGVFEGIKFYDAAKGAAIFRLSEHIDRLLKGASVIGMKAPYSKTEIIDGIKNLVRFNGLKSGYIRPILYYGEGAMQVIPQGLPVNLAIALWPLKSYLSAEIANVAISSYTRDTNATNIRVKISGNYITSILSGLEARKKGRHEALLLDSNGFIAEGSAENVFFVLNNVLITPRLGGILPGITRDSIITIARDAGFEVKERDIKPEEIKDFSEAFFCGTATEIVPIGQIDSIRFGSGIGHVTKKLKLEFLNIVNGKNDKYAKWLTYVY